MTRLDHRRVEILAYHYWQDRGRPIGTPHEDWLRAEAELKVEGPIAELSLSLCSLIMEPSEQ